MTGRKSFWIAGALASAFFPQGAGAAEFTAERWRVAEIPLTSATAYVDPFQDVDVTATFTGPGGVTITRPAFWDGGTTWRVRFAPTVAGTWTMTTSCTDAGNAGLNGVSHTVQCSPYSGTLDIYKHGFLKVAENGRYFTYADGTPFFYLGDTHWIFIHERFNTSNVSGIPSQFKYIVDKRVDQGFTVYQTEAIHVPHGSGAHNSPTEEPHADFSDGFTAADLPGLMNMDRKFAYVADKGMVHAHAGITWTVDPATFPIFTEAYMSRLGRYWSARFGAYPLLWTVAQEIDPYVYGTFNASTIGRWHAGAKGIADNDAYKQPLGAHMENMASMGSTPANSTWQSRPYHSWWPVQMQGDLAGHGGPRNFYQNSPAKPVVLYESPYENFWTDTKGARGAGYKSFQWGMCGYGYGAAGVWNDIYEVGDYGTDYEMPQRYLSWYDGAQLAGAAQMTYLKNFYTALEWWKFVPHYDNAAWSAFADPNRSLLSSDGNSTYVAYFFGSGRSTGALRGMAATTYEASWFNPRTGETTRIGGLRPTSGQWSVPQRPTDDDWVLLAKQSTQTIVSTPASGGTVSASQTGLSWEAVGLATGLNYQIRFGDAARYDATKANGNLPLLTPAGGITATSYGLPGPLTPGVTYYWILEATDPAAATTSKYVFSFVVAGGSVAVENGSFETSGPAGPSAGWTQIASGWSPQMTSGYQYQQNNLSPATSAHFTVTTPGGGTWYALLNENTGHISQNLNTLVNSGDTLSVTFYGGRGRTGVSTSPGGVFNASFVVGSEKYTMPVDTSTVVNNGWQAFTLTKTITNSGSLSLEFSAVSGNPWLDLIGPVAITPAEIFGVALTSPTEGQRILSGTAVNASVTVNKATGPCTVTYELGPVNGPRTVVGSSSTPPYTVALGTLAIGTYDLQATLVDQGAGGATTRSVLRSFIVSPDILIPVENASFETTGTLTGNAWARAHAGWNPINTASAAYQQNSEADSISRHINQTPSGTGVWYLLMNANTGSIQRDLGAQVNAGDIVSVTFYGGRGRFGLSTAPGGTFKAAITVGTEVYEMTVDTSTQAYDSWQAYTLTKTVTNSGNLGLRFTAVSGDPWLDEISPVKVTPAGAVSGFNSWMSGQTGVAENQRGFLADPNQDGLVNGAVWMLGGTNVLANASTLRPVAGKSTDGLLTLTFPCLPLASRGNAVLELQYSEDAVTWQTASVPGQTGSVSGVDFTVTGSAPLQVVAKVPKIASAPNKGFARLKITLP